MAFLDSHLFGTFDAADGTTYLPQSVRFIPPTKTQAYLRHTRAGKRAATFNDKMYEDDPGPVHTLVMWIKATDRADLEPKLADLVNAIVPGARWYFTAKGSALTTSALVNGVTRSEPVHLPMDGTSGYSVAFAIETKPGWKKSTSVIDSGTITPATPYFDTSTPEGDMRADTVVRMTSADATSAQYLGMRSAPDAALTFAHNFDGDTTYASRCYNGAAAKLEPLSSTLTQIDITSVLSTDAYDGMFALLARVLQNDATPADTTFQGFSRVSGSGISESADHLEQAVPAVSVASSGADILNLGDYPMPPVSVPSGATGSGYGAVGTVLSQTNAASKWSACSPPSGYTPMQTFTLANFIMLDSIAVKVDNTNGLQSYMRLTLYRWTGSYWIRLLGSYLDVSATDAVRTFDFDGWECSPGTYCWVLDTLGKPYYNSTNPYAGGQAFRYIPTDEEATFTAADYDTTSIGATSDFYFTVTGRARLGFDGYLGVKAANSGGGAAWLDYLLALPVDEFALFAKHAFAADEGMLSDSMIDDVLLAKSTSGTSFSLLHRSSTDQCERRGDGRLRPGVVNRFAALGAKWVNVPEFSISVEHWPVFSLPPGV